MMRRVEDCLVRFFGDIAAVALPGNERQRLTDGRSGAERGNSRARGKHTKVVRSYPEWADNTRWKCTKCHCTGHGGASYPVPSSSSARRPTSHS